MKKFFKYLFLLLILTALTGLILHYNADSLLFHSAEKGKLSSMNLALRFKNDEKNLIEERNDLFNKIFNDVKFYKFLKKYRNGISKYDVLKYALSKNSRELVQYTLDDFDFADYRNLKKSFLDNDIVKAKNPEIFKLFNLFKFELSNVIIHKMLSNEYSQIKEVFESNGRYDIKSESGLTPLMCAVINRDYDLFDFLIFNKADVNASYKDGDTPLFMAIRNKPDFRIIKTLIENGARINIKNGLFETPLELLVEKPGNEEIIKYLIDRGADIDSKINAYSRAVFLNRREYARMMVESGLPASAINIAAQIKNDKWPAIDYIIKNGVDMAEILNICVKVNDIESFKKLAGSVDDPDVKSRSFKSMLLNVANLPVKYLKYLIEQGADITVTDTLENTVLMKAVDSNNIDNIMLLIDCGIDVNARDRSGETALIKLIKNKQDIKFITTILNAGADVNIRDACGNDVFHYLKLITVINNRSYYFDYIPKLLQSYKVPVSRELFKKREAAGYNKMTFAELEKKFEDALENNNLESAEIYLGSYLYIDNYDRMDTKIIKSNNLEFLKLYIKYIEIYCSDYVDNKINHIIFEALMQRCDLSILRYLLEYVTDIDEKIIGEAVIANNNEALKLLISAEFIKKISSRPDSLNCILGYAVEHENIEAGKIIAKLIRPNEIESGRSSSDHQRLSLTPFPLVESIIFGCDDIARILMEKKINVNKKYYNGFTALAYASWYGRDELIKVLLSKGADPGIGTNDGTTPLMYASMAGNTGAIELLIKNGADVNAKNKNGIDALCEAITSGRTKAVELLKAKGADIKESERILKKIKRTGTNINSRDSHGITMLAKAAYEKDFFKTKLLIDRGAFVNNYYSNGEHEILSAALAYTPHYNLHENLLKLLIDKGADLYCNNNETAFTNILIRCTPIKNKINLLKNKPDSIDISKMSNLIEAAISDGNIEWLSLLLDKGVDINCSVTPYDEHGVLPRMPLFFFAAYKYDYRILELMLKKGVDINARARRDSGSDRELTWKICDSTGFSSFKEYGGNALFFINSDINVTSNKTDDCIKILEMLVKAGCDINARNDYGYTPIFTNSITMSSSFLKSMIALGADVNVRGTDELKLTPIFAACTNEWDPEVLNVLIDNGAEVNQTAQDLWTPLMFAVHARNPRSVEILIKRGAKINEANADGMTALDILNSYCYRADDVNIEILNLLLSAGAVSRHKKYECK